MLENVTQDIAGIKFPVLSDERYLLVQQEAEQRVKTALNAPKQEDYAVPEYENEGTELPRWLIIGVVGALVIVTLLSLWVSGGKQIAATGLIVDHLSREYLHLSVFWSDVSIIAMLGLGEFGAILFSIAASLFAGTTVLVKGYTIRPVSLVFRLFAIACSLFAVVSNIAVTALDPVPQVAALQWLTAIVVPLIVLAIGLMAEQMIMTNIKNRAEQKAFRIHMQRENQAGYLKALDTYNRYIHDPTSHDLYMPTLGQRIYEAMTHFAKDRKPIEAYVQGAIERKFEVVTAEYHSHQTWSSYDAREIHSLSQPSLYPAIEREVNQPPKQTES